MKSEDITDDEIRLVASNIVLGQTEDIEYLTVTEVADDQIDGIRNMSEDEQEKVWHRVDAMVRRAEVTITFK